MKRAVCLLILVSMMLHCASRLGFLTYLYQYRHNVAYSVGLIAEIPIALCSSDYDDGKGLTIQQHEQSEKSLPATLVQAHEINLYFERILFTTTLQFTWLTPDRIPNLTETPYTPPLQDIFHPPTAA